MRGNAAGASRGNVTSKRGKTRAAGSDRCDGPLVRGIVRDRYSAALKVEYGLLREYGASRCDRDAGEDVVKPGYLIRPFSPRP